MYVLNTKSIGYGLSKLKKASVNNVVYDALKIKDNEHVVNMAKNIRDFISLRDQTYDKSDINQLQDIINYLCIEDV